MMTDLLPESLRMAAERIAVLETEVARLSVDAVTGLAPRGVFDHALEIEIARAARDTCYMGVVLIDVDNFKAVNDCHGHQSGDKILQRIAAAMRLFRRRSDTLARFGGDEFAMVLPRTNPGSLMKVCHSIRRAVEYGNGTPTNPRITVSVGCTIIRPADTPESMIKRADANLLTAKRTGRNHVIGY